MKVWYFFNSQSHLPLAERKCLMQIFTRELRFHLIEDFLFSSPKNWNPERWCDLYKVTISLKNSKPGTKPNTCIFKRKQKNYSISCFLACYTYLFLFFTTLRTLHKCHSRTQHFIIYKEPWTMSKPFDLSPLTILITDVVCTTFKILLTNTLGNGGINLGVWE